MLTWLTLPEPQKHRFEVVDYRVMPGRLEDDMESMIDLAHAPKEGI